MDSLIEQANSSPRLWMNMDFRNSASDGSQRMLNAIEPGTVMLIDRHHGSSETAIGIRGHFEEYLYDEAGHLIETIDMVPGGSIVNVFVGQCHNLHSLVEGEVKEAVSIVAAIETA